MLRLLRVGHNAVAIANMETGIAEPERCVLQPFILSSKPATKERSGGLSHGADE